ncbi:neuronal acetylcholine receptor subunit alpha-3 [Elysia marginata]|uniref:Neuronal acetylcholine receptor subunit alpha-3 n=1 Tax=Elysia marginata TaxID=1093978 RepID=A0AAV4H4L3_9GAST|nr:neuronal acetylcholine receptor subunit alpha-3 [Elysia marginata]
MGLLGVTGILLPFVLTLHVSQAGSYDQHRSIHATLLDSGQYNRLQRPLRDQGDVLRVMAMFELVSIVEINDVIQSFKCNGFFGLLWQDELLQWNSSAYGGARAITPGVTSVFLPKMILLNTLGDRDIFEDDNAPLSVSSNGSVIWVPGSIFPTSCRLDLTKFPFDEQHCDIQMIGMNFDANEMQFVVAEKAMRTAFYTPNGQWDITRSSLTTPNITVGWTTQSSILVSFDLKRKPASLILSTLLPVVFLSLLNCLVFVIPVDSGEKISYGITVLLALALFMSIMSGMLPSSSESLPLIMYYIFILLAISVLTVVDSIIIVWLHHKQEASKARTEVSLFIWCRGLLKKSTSKKATFNVPSVMAKIRAPHVAVGPLQRPDESIPESKKKATPGGRPCNVNHLQDIKKSRLLHPGAKGSEGVANGNKYKQVAAHLNRISLAVFGLVWFSVTVGFMAAVMS